MIRIPLTFLAFGSIVMTMRSVIGAALMFAVVATAAPAWSQQSGEMGQISGVASAPGAGTLANATVRLRDLSTKEVIGTVTTNASGQFVFVVDGPGSFIVEILDAQGGVIGTTAPIVLSQGAMVVSGVAVSFTAGGAAAAAPGGAAGNQGPTEGPIPAAGAMAGGGVSNNIFMPTLPSVSAAATGSGVVTGSVPSRGTVSPSR